MTLTELHDKLKLTAYLGITAKLAPGFGAALRTVEALFEQQKQDVQATRRILKHQAKMPTRDDFDIGFQEGIIAALSIFPEPIMADYASEVDEMRRWGGRGPGFEDHVAHTADDYGCQLRARLQNLDAFNAELDRQKKLSLIGITGLAGSGKDTVAALLYMLGYERRAFADALRKEAAEYIRRIKAKVSGNGITRCEQQYGTDIVEMIHVGRIKPEDVYLKPTPPAIRELLQKHGTEFRRAQNENYWIDQIFAGSAKAISPLTVISDVRFPNEAEAIRDRGGVIWRVQRNVPMATHLSELGQSAINADATIDNNGSLLDLAKKVKVLL